MMKHKKLYLSILLVGTLLFFSGCATNDNVQSTESESFAIYLVKDNNASSALNMDINDLKLEDKPIVTDHNIEEYDWALHKFTFVEDEEFMNGLKDKVYMKVPTDGKPFVVICDGERIYIGTFWTGLSSLFSPDCPIISSDFGDNNFFEINSDSNDTRNDDRVYKVLERIGKLK